MKVNSMKRKTVGSFTVFLLTTMLVVFGCGGSGGGGGGSSSNNAPVAVDGAITVAPDTTYTGSLSASDADGDAMTFTIASNPTMGTVNITDVATGAYTYTPNAGVTGSDSFTFYASDGTENSNTATVTVTISVNTPPTADAPDDFSADELSMVSLAGTGSDAEDGTSVTYSWSQTAGPVNVTLLNADTATAQFAAPAVETGTNVLLSFKLTVTDSGSLTAEDTVDVTIDAAGHIIGVVSAPDYHTNLTEEGTRDWASFGYYTDLSFISKMGGTGELSNYTELGDVTPNKSSGNPVAFSWTDGDPDTPNHNPADQARTRVRFTDTDVDEGIRLSVPAGVEDKILRVYLGAYSHKGKVTVRLLNDTGVTPYTVSLDNPYLIQEAWVVTILFGAASDGDYLQFDFQMEEDTGAVAGGHINLAAATLTEAQAMTPIYYPLPGTYTDAVSLTLASAPAGTTIRYTQDGSQPTTSSSAYTGAITLTENKTVNAKAYYPGLNNSSAASGSYVIDTTATGTLAANVAKPPYHTDLTQEGTLDWASFGYYTNLSFISKMGGTDELSNYSEIGDVTPLKSDGNPVAFSWTDGDPDTPNHNPADQTRTRVRFTDTDEDEGIRLTIPADDVEKTLKVYLGAYSMEGKVTVHMDDDSVPVYTTTLSSTSEIQEAWVVTVDFAAPTGTTSNLIFEYVQGQDLGVAGGHINIAAASLTDQ